MRKNVAKFVCVNAVVAAIYVVFTMPFGTLTFGAIQFRPAEALTILPALLPYTIVGLTIGCGISNLVSAFGLADVLLGSFVTLVAGILTSTRVFNKYFVAPVPPVVLNALFLPLIWMISGPLQYVYWLQVVFLLISQSVVIFGLGIPLYFVTKRKILPLMML